LRLFFFFGKTFSMSASNFFSSFLSAPSCYLMLGGFLGAGKSTLLREFIRLAQRRGLKCGLVTNDQGDGLVDTALGHAAGVSVREVSGGCFCCRAGDLVTALERLAEQEQPDIFLAEPVGSCTDLVATVLLPLQQVYKLPLRIAPMTVVVDAARFRDDFLAFRKRKGFSKGVRYIWAKQLEEAEVIVLNKADALTADELEKVKARVQADWPGRSIRAVSARTGEHIEELFDFLLGTEARAPRSTMEVDYDLYGRGEAELGWYNARLSLVQPAGGVNPLLEVDGNEFLEALANKVQRDLEAQAIEIGHFKMALTRTDAEGQPLRGSGHMAVVQSARSGTPGELTLIMNGRVEHAELLINLRAEADPTVLEQTVARHLAGRPFRTESLAAFHPGQPNPTHRVQIA
jgi:G3E family GTPase